LYLSDTQSSQDNRQDVAQQLRATAAPALDPVEFLVERLGLRRVFLHGHLLERSLEVTQHGRSVRLVFAVERHELGQDVVPSLDAGVAEDLPAGDDLVGDAAEARGNLDARVPRVLAVEFPGMGQRVEVVVALDEVIGRAQDGGAQFTVATADEGPLALST